MERSEASLRPYDDPYPGQIRRIHDLLLAGVPVAVEHEEFATRKELVITPASAMARFGGWVANREGWHLSWTYTGSMWIPLDTVYDGLTTSIDASYVAEKLSIRKWWLDAQSIVAFIKSIATCSVVKAKEE